MSIATLIITDMHFQPLGQKLCCDKLQCPHLHVPYHISLLLKEASHLVERYINVTFARNDVASGVLN